MLASVYFDVRGANMRHRLFEWGLGLGFCMLNAQAAMAQTDAGSRGEEVSVIVDPRVEVASVVQLLDGGYPLVSEYESEYRQSVASYFSAAGGHPAVSIFRRLRGEGLAFDAVPKTLLRASAPPSMRLVLPLGEELESRGLDPVEIRDFLEALGEFARDTDFDRFFAAHAVSYGRWIAETAPAVRDASRAVTAYGGADLGRRTVVLGPLLHDGGFAARLGDSELEAYAFIGPSGVVDGRPVFGPLDRIASLVSHEFAHLFVNRLVEAHAETVAELAPLFEPIADVMARQAYPRWEIALNEHLVRAVVIRLLLERDGAEAAEAETERQEARGFRYVRALAARLEDYERARDRYPAFADFYPVILAELRSIADGS
jgi:hypothetical protein